MCTRYIVSEFRCNLPERGWRDIASFDTLEKARKYIRVFGNTLHSDYQIIKETWEKTP